jgi:NAD(P)-dependent dehydrogenase (short-subunit alcohol dehydrogenase family)
MDIFQDKIAIVTGGGWGIGRETALGLARMGATVAVIAGYFPTPRVCAGVIRNANAQVVETHWTAASFADARRMRW